MPETQPQTQPETLLDIAYLRTEANPDDDAARLAFYARLAEAELFLLLETEAKGDQLSPRVFALEDGPVVLAFDTEARLSEFTGLPAPYAALPGRALVQMLVADPEAGLGLGLNLGVAPSSRLLPAEILRWLADTLENRPTELQARASEIFAPKGLPDNLLTALDATLARAGGLAVAAYLAQVAYDDGSRGHMLAFVGASDGAEPTLARAVAQALTFSGVEAGALDVTFLAASDGFAARLARVGLRFDLPKVAAATGHTPKAPGMDPDAPPKLR